MPTIYQNKFDGGHAEDIRTTRTDQCEKSLNFDVFTNPHKLIPFGDSVAETTGSSTMDDIEISDVDVSLIGSSYVLTGTGYETNISPKPTFWTKTDLTNGGVLNWTSQAVSAGNTYQKGSHVVYKNKSYVLGYNGSNQYTLYRYDSAGSVATIGTISSSSIFIAKPFVHPEDNVLYVVIGTVIAKYDGSTLTSSSTILPTGFEATSLTDYGTYLHIMMRPLRGNGNSTGYLWGRDITLNTLQGVLDWGEGNAFITENLNNGLVAIMQPQNAFSTTITPRIDVRYYAGGAIDTVKSINVLSTQAAVSAKVKNAGKLYFGLIRDDCVYCFGKNKGGEYILTKDRYLDNGSLIGASLGGLSMIGDVLWRGITTVLGVYKLMRSKISGLGETITYTSTSVYKTTINPGMVIEDRDKLKQLEAVEVLYIGKVGGTIAMKYGTDDATMTSIIAENTTAVTTFTQATDEAAGVVFTQGKEFQFQLESTGGVEILGYKYRYKVLNSTI